MTSARIFYSSASLWSSLTPMLEPVVRWINVNDRVYAGRVAPIGGEVTNNALIAESAFFLAASWLKGSRELTPREAALKAEDWLRSQRDYPQSSVQLDEDECTEISGLATSILSFLEGEVGEKRFSPVLPGCGSIDAATADILLEGALIEVKSVTRPWRSQDLRQILTYTALLYASGTMLDNFILLNPRRGRVARASVEFLSQACSGQSAPELLHEIIDAMAGVQTSA